jgi:hypothetical protein
MPVNTDNVEAEKYVAPALHMVSVMTEDEVATVMASDLVRTVPMWAAGAVVFGAADAPVEAAFFRTKFLEAVGAVYDASFEAAKKLHVKGA